MYMHTLQLFSQVQQVLARITQNCTLKISQVRIVCTIGLK